MSALKAAYRDSYLKHKGENQDENERLSRKYNEAMKDIVAIPENKFIPLKAKHQYKVSLSKSVSDFPNTPVFILRTRLRWVGITQVFSNRK